MTWSVGTRACKTVWSTLVILDQMHELVLFLEAGQRKMQDLLFFANDAADTTLGVRARGLAFTMDSIFRIARGAEFEDEITHNQAIEAMVEVLIDKDKTVENLADVADDQYRFHGEA